MGKVRLRGVRECTQGHTATKILKRDVDLLGSKAYTLIQVCLSECIFKLHFDHTYFNDLISQMM